MTILAAAIVTLAPIGPPLELEVGVPLELVAEVLEEKAGGNLCTPGLDLPDLSLGGLLGENPLLLHISLFGVDVLGSHSWGGAIDLSSVWQDSP